MKKLNVNFLFPLFALSILIFALSVQMFMIPPLGKLLDPFIGLVHNEGDPGLETRRLDISNTGLSDSVSVFFDNRKVPHIYAANTTDLYFAQGYVTAYMRLWQMDFLTYASAGRLSEIFSEGYLEYDRNQRRIGMLDAAKASLALIEKDETTQKILTAYSKGVNAYISQLNYKNMPFEYKFLDYSPEPWTNLKTVLIMKYMASTLSGYDEDYNMSNMMLTLGEEKFNQLFPDFHPNTTPVVNNYITPANPLLGYTKKPGYLDYSFLASRSVISKSEYNPKLGSNSWVVSGKKTKSGFPILASDPHLNLTLPCIWIEMQLSSPGMNVYGVSIPGTPAVIIGFNENIAWALTNGQDDVRDWYKLKISEDYKKYEFDGQWVDLRFTIEEIKRKGQKPFYDTVYHTIHGPVAYNKSFTGPHAELSNYALKWELHNPSNEFLTFIKLSTAANYGEYKEAIKNYCSPVQNFTFACKDNSIAVNHQGSMAIKWPGQGKFILDGSQRSHLYTNNIPEDSLPYLLNPACNYVVSANQHPTDSNYAYYYSGYFNENRANRIRQLLENENAFDIAKVEAMQLDNTSSFSVTALPVLLPMINKAPLKEIERSMLSGLQSWKGAYDYNSGQAQLFELWWKRIKELSWDEFKQYPFGSKTPDDYILLNLVLTDPANIIFDKQGTSARETATDIVREAFIQSVTSYNKDPRKKWSDFHRVNIMHMSQIGAFSRVNLPSSGYPEAINATAGGYGPSWRMIVELGDRPKAVGIYAGGQSGNIGSPYFDDFVNDWNKGSYYPLTFFISVAEARQQSTTTWTLR